MSNIVEFVKQQESMFVGALSDNSVSWAKESQFAIQAFQANDYLAKIAIGNPSSAQNAIVNLAAIGITLNPAKKLCYLVPRRVGQNTAVCLDISYMGLMHIAQQSGAVTWCQSAIVRKNDVFQREFIDQAPIHKYNDFDTKEQRGDIVGAYVIIKTPDGDYLTHTMRISDIYDIRDRSEAWKSFQAGRAKSCPWVTDEEQMILKTVVKQGAKYWPRRDRLDAAIDYVNTDAGEGIQFDNSSKKQERDVSPITAGQSDRINEILNMFNETFDSLKNACEKLAGRRVETQLELTSSEASMLISSLERKIKAKAKAEAEKNA